MFHKTIGIVHRKISIIRILPKRCSALFINGPKATENYVFLVPHVDFPEQVNDKDSLQSMIDKRKSNFDLQKLQDLWHVYGDLKKLKTEQENKKSTLSKQLSTLQKQDMTGNDVEKLKIQISLLKENIKNLKVPLWSAEEAAMLEALKLPNMLHPDTPDGENKVIFEHAVKQCKKQCVGNEGLYKFTPKNNYYLLGNAALFELGAEFYFSNHLKKHNFVQFSNPDFVKSLIVEASGLDHTNPNSTFILYDNESTTPNKDKRLHLTGAGSLCSFLAYHAKNVIYSKVLPLKYFSIGRQYTPSVSECSLLDVNQSSVVQVFAVSKSNEDLDQILNEILQIVKQMYCELNYHFRLSYVTADKLYSWESLRISIEMYSSSTNKYVEVGNLSLSGDFLSKRLMFTYSDNKLNKFPHILSGTILNVPKLLACALESTEKFSLPDVFKLDKWKSLC